jgi:hypothetical protein
LQGERNRDQLEASERSAPLSLKAGKACAPVATSQMQTQQAAFPPGERAVEVT